ncbi:MAG: NAD-dependent protein deacylase [Defluviitaleaceae bacterium]|nr:NAD-dependent protein deacylase [Defluviitaleaceae bacterium]
MKSWDKEISALKKIINDSDNIVFFGGAGVSTESGIPDFRSVDGLYNQEYDYPPEVILSSSFFREKTAEFYKFYRNKMIIDGIKPNKAHHALAKLEADGKLRAVITQNIDGLHQAAGSKNVLELHGSVARNFCTVCRKPHSLDTILASKVPHCECGGLVKPDVVLYEERLNQSLLQQAADYISRADVVIIGGTSLSVYPAAGLIYYYTGDKLVMINNSETTFDERVNLMIRTSIGKALEKAVL